MIFHSMHCLSDLCILIYINKLCSCITFYFILRAFIVLCVFLMVLCILLLLTSIINDDDGYD